MAEKSLTAATRHGGARSVLLVVLVLTGCAVRRTIRIEPAQVPPPAREASLAELVEKVNAESRTIQTLTATVDLEPTAGSVYSGVIKEYRDVRGFILVERPAMIRMIGQAPIVRANIFDMVSDGEEFRVYIPPKNKFIVGKTAFRRPAKNALENMRPQHILDALLVPPIDSARDKHVLEEAEEDGRRYYVVMVLDAGDDGSLALKRKIWLDRINLQIVRVQLYGPEGAYIEDVRYSGHQDFSGVLYPSQIQLTRPVEDYRLLITFEKAIFNQPISPEKFKLVRPESADLVELGSGEGSEGPGGQ